MWSRKFIFVFLTMVLPKIIMRCSKKNRKKIKLPKVFTNFSTSVYEVPEKLNHKQQQKTRRKVQASLRFAVIRTESYFFFQNRTIHITRPCYRGIFNNRLCAQTSLISEEISETFAFTISTNKGS